MRRSPLKSVVCVLCLLSIAACRERSRPEVGYDPANDTLRKTETIDTVPQAPKDSTPVSQAPIPTPIPPERLAEFLPAMDGFLAGELQKETRIRPNFKSSKVMQTYTSGTKKFVIEINDYCNVPFLYEPFQKFMEGDYLNDDNIERTETTTIKGFKAVQTIEKKASRGNIFVFPGDRFVISLIGENITDINELRQLAESIDLRALSIRQ